MQVEYVEILVIVDGLWFHLYKGVVQVAVMVDCALQVGVAHFPCLNPQIVESLVVNLALSPVESVIKKHIS